MTTLATKIKWGHIIPNIVNNKSKNIREYINTNKSFWVEMINADSLAAIGRLKVFATELETLFKKHLKNNPQLITDIPNTVISVSYKKHLTPTREISDFSDDDMCLFSELEEEKKQLLSKIQDAEALLENLKEDQKLNANALQKLFGMKEVTSDEIVSITIK